MLTVQCVCVDCVLCLVCVRLYSVYCAYACFGAGIQLEKAGPGAMIRNLDIVFAYIFQVQIYLSLVCEQLVYARKTRSHCLARLP